MCAYVCVYCPDDALIMRHYSKLVVVIVDEKVCAMKKEEKNVNLPFDQMQFRCGRASLESTRKANSQAVIRRLFL